MALDNLRKYEDDYSFQGKTKEITEEKLILESVGASDTKRDLPILKRFAIGNTKAQNEIVKTDFEELINRKVSIDVTKEQQKEYLTTITIDPSNVRLPDNYNYTLQDDLLVNAIGNLIELEEVREQNGFVSVKHIVNVMNGKDYSSRVSDKEIKNAYDNIKRLMGITITIDASGHQEYNRQNKRKHQIEKAEIDGNMINALLINKGGQQRYVRVLDYPPLYQYAKATGQIISFKYDDLDLMQHIEYNEETGQTAIKKTDIKRMTPQIRSIRDFLFKRIGWIRNSKLTSTISYETIYKFLDDDIESINLNNSSTRQNVNKNIEKVLNALKTKKVIRGYDVKHKGAGGKLAAIKIFLHKK